MRQDRSYPRVPREYQGIQVNHCKNSNCKYFGIPAKTDFHQGKDNYRLTGGKSSIISLKCKFCGKYSALKSNEGIYEEYQRIYNLHNPSELISCRNEKCKNHLTSVTEGKQFYSAYGKTKAGSKRYKCKACGKIFSFKGQANLRQRRKDVNSMVFRLLVNKGIMRRICEIVDIHPATLYSKINFIHKQCVLFSSHKEHNFFNDQEIKRLYVSTDRQEYVFNWGSQLDRRNVKLHSIGTADNVSGFVFGMHLDFDPTINSEELEKKVSEVNDYELPIPYRKYGRYWLQGDYVDHSLGLPIGKPSPPVTGSENEDGRFVNENLKRPSVGVQVRMDYTQFGHFYYLADLFQKVEKVRFFLDREPGIDAAVSSAFKNKVANSDVDAFFVSINKNLTVDQKKSLKAQGGKNLKRFFDENPGLTQKEAEIEYLIEAISGLSIDELSKNRISHPTSNMNEPQKTIQWITPRLNYENEHVARLYRLASLHSIDRFFMLVRRRLSVFERPIASASNQNRSWYGYSAYNPEIGMKLLDIFRVYYNYSLMGKDKSVPAARIGIVNKPVSLEEILEFIPSK
ncbi:MAG: hypothetical protein IMF09_12300 [Proteobacteria bacterium]|nr:hypothetical protein [Pseudomonadota bacterium]